MSGGTPSEDPNVASVVLSVRGILLNRRGTFILVGGWPLQGMSLGFGIAGTAVSAISFLTLAAVARDEVAPSPAEVAPAAFAYFTGDASPCESKALMLASLLKEQILPCF